MMEKCFDEATLQAFLDNELPSELSQAIARHLADCDPCAILLAEVEEETAVVFSALEQEFNTLVPTLRLWTKINDSIETQSRNRSVWQKLLGFVAGLNLLNPQIIAFGSLLLIVGVVSVLLVVKNDFTAGDAADTKPTIPSVSTAKIDIQTPPEIKSPVVTPTNINKTKNSTTPQYRAENANYVENSRKPIEKPNVIPKPKPFVPQYLDGEESYINTIARLEKTVDGSKDEVLKSSARFSYEKDLAVVNDTIDKMKKEVKKNPKNEDAKQVLFSSYQNKIELLNSVTQRGELMASMR